MENGSRFPTVALACLVTGILCLGGCDKGEEDQTASERKAQAREMVQSVLNHWDWKTWNQLLADDVVLSLNVGSVDESSIVGGKVTFRGREAAKAALKKFYGELKKSVSFWGQIAEGYEVALLGDLSVVASAEQGKDELPFLAYLRFNEEGKVEHMALATVDMRPLVDALRESAKEPE